MLVESLLKVALFGATWVMYLLIVLSILSIGVMVERWWFFSRNLEKEHELGSVVRGALARSGFGGVSEALASRRSVEASILRGALAFVPAGADALQHAFRSEYDKQKGDLERGINFLGTLGSNGPFIGLFGTVIGVIEAFHHLGAGNDDAAMAAVMAGIAEALVATGVGLFVAIPAVIAYNLAQSRVDRVESEIGVLINEICADIEASARGVKVVRPAEDDAEPSAAAAE